MCSRGNFFNSESAKYYNPVEERKVAIVTGGNSGIGWYTALHLYIHGFSVYIAGRNDKKVAAAIEEILSEANARVSAYSDIDVKLKPVGELKSLYIDCCDLKSVEDCANDFISKESRLDLLINNAGVMGVPYEMTKDGYEIQYQVNLVAPFLFTMKLLPVLEHTKAVGSVPRVITLSSIGHRMSVKYWDPKDTLKRFPGAMYTWVRYGNAKRGAIEFMSKFAQEYCNILAFSVHPGVITDTRLYDYWTNLPALGYLFKLSFQGVGKIMGVSSEEGSLATLRAALDPELGSEQSGSYLVTGGIIEPPSSVASDEKNINTTWNYLHTSLVERGFLKDL